MSFLRKILCSGFRGFSDIIKGTFLIFYLKSDIIKSQYIELFLFFLHGVTGE